MTATTTKCIYAERAAIAWLQVVGALLAAEDNWAEIKKDLKNAKNLEHNGENVFSILHISYGRLEEEAKEMFLDVACVMAGWPKARAIAIWQG
jgi:hypothetical protein